MKILEKTQEGAVVKARVEMTDEELQPYFEKAYKKTQKNIELPGFRKGKVPLSMIIKRFGPAVRAEALEDIITEVYPKIVDESGEKPIAPGDVEEPDYQDGEYLRFTAIMEIKPEFELVDWKALEVKMEVADVTDDDINTHLDYMRKDKAIVSEAQDDQGADGVDRLTVNLQQLDENGVEVIGKSFKDITFEFGTDYLGPNTDEQLKGIKKEETRKIMTERHIHPEEGEHVDEKYGWEVTPTKIEKVELPELDDDFAVQVDEKYESMDDLRAAVRSDIEAYAKYHVDQRMADRILNTVVDAHDFALPPTLLEETLGRMLERQKEESQNMIPEDTLRENLKPYAERQLKWFFLEQKLIEELKVEATDEDIEKHLEIRAEQVKDTDLESLKLMFKAGERREMLANEIVKGKLMDELRNGMKLVEEKVALKDVLQ